MAGIKITQAVILAGGQGVRLRPLTLHTPKPLIEIHNKPFLEYLLTQLRKNGIKEVILLVGYLSNKFKEYLGDGKKFGLNIRYSYAPVEAETGARLLHARPLINQYFLLLYGDNYWPLELPKLIDYYLLKKRRAQVTVFSNHDKSTKNNIYLNSDGLVTKYDKTRKSTDLNGVDIGFFIMEKSLLSLIPDENCTFEEILISKLIERKELTGFLTHSKYYSLSALERIPAIKEYFRSKKIVLLDRDGVINKKAKKAHYITSCDQFEFLPDVKQSLKILKDNGFQIYVITNQPAVAKGLMTKRDLSMIHRLMREELASIGVRIEKIYTCTHGWNDGCFCRKPNPGLFFRAAAENHIKLAESFAVGDDIRDVMAGSAASCKTVFINSKKGKKLKNYPTPDIIDKSLLGAVNKIIEYTQKI